MARPIKNNADYFPHDADMRNDPRVKALRRKFKLEGYAIYSMMIEMLTDSDFFQVKTDKLTIEIIAGDFDCEAQLLEDVINYCKEIDLFQMSETGILRCKSLDNRLNPLLSKRKREQIVVIDNDNTQSKVKESKVDKIKVDESKVKEGFFIEVNQKIVTDPMQILEFHEVQLNGMETENNKRAWRPLVAPWFNDHLGEAFEDGLHVKNSFKRFYLSKSDLNPIVKKTDRQRKRDEFIEFSKQK